jgi:NAD(P)-dependent dehydrogenase (short-subunit alcohol dehydrogenase family)/acyl carrier protein
VVATGAGSRAGASLSEWPPAGAEEVAIGDFYASAERDGYQYGPNFRGLRAAWRRGEELFAEAVVPEEGRAEAGRFGLHPALLDSALHVSMLQRRTGDVDAGAWLPFLWSDVSLHAAGATALRIRLTPVGAEKFAVNVADAAGRPVASVETMLSRQISAKHFAASDDTLRQALFEVTWRPLPVGRDARVGPGCAVLGSDVLGLAEALGGAQVYPALGALDADAGSRPEFVVVPCVATGGDDPAQVAIDLSGGVLALLQDWLANERWEATRLVVVTTGAMVVEAGEQVIDPAAASVWGLVRSATAEHPGRFLLVDQDASAESNKVLPTALACAIEQDETELVLRQGNVFVPRLAPLVGELEPRTPELGSGTVLITGGTGVLGGLLARHVARVHHVPHLVLLGRRGRSAPGMTELENDLVGLGTRVTVAECDATDRAELGKVLAGIDPECPLIGIVHAAGVLEDSTVEALSSSQLERVMAPKVRTAWNLHELTQDQQLSMFVMFSSASGLLGTAGQANYAAANTFLDALAQYRRAHGLTARSLAWGLWEQASGMTGHLDDVQLERVRRAGMLRLPTRDGLALFDGCLRADPPVVVPARFNAADLRTQADRGRLPGLLRGVVRSSVRRVAEVPVAEGRNVLQRLLEGVAAGDRERTLVELVAKQAAEVLGRDSSADVVEEQSFRELGFESLTAVELRNRLSKATGMRLPATLVFDHPSPAAVARHLLSVLCPDQGNEERRSDVIGEVTVTAAEDDPAALLASLDVDDLVRMALGDDGS